MPNKREYRFVPATELRVAPAADGKRTLSGYAATFNTRSEDLGGFTEEIAPGAFKRSLASKPDVMMLHEHDSKRGLLGRTKSGTLKLAEDSKGLKFDCDLPNTTLGNDIAESVNRGDLDSCSFGFTVPDGGSTWVRSGDNIVRTLKDVDLVDCSVVGTPAYPSTSVHMRSLMFPDGFLLEGEFPPTEATPIGDKEATDFQIVSDKLLADLCERKLRS